MGARLCSIFPVFINHPAPTSEGASEQPARSVRERAESGRRAGGGEAAAPGGAARAASERSGSL